MSHYKGYGLALLLLTLLTGTSIAETPFYFIARVAPEGSISQAGQSPQRVYLRWDLLEGSLPADIISFSLRRDGELIKTFPANGVMDPAQIRSLYQGPAEQRRLLETVGQLMEEASLDANMAPFEADQYATRINERLTNDAFWGHLASRMDFNLAVARYRGWHDENLTPGIYSYELIAHNDEGQQRRIGMADVDLIQPQQILSPLEFAQIEQASCDLPDFRDHYSVALNWAMPGANNQADRLANQLFVAGFDLYRSVDNVDSAPTRDLAAEAASLDHDERGWPQFSDLERVNDTLLTITPDSDALTPEWLETRPDLLSAGLIPGDTRAYYLVPRDIAGQYGPTVETLVTVHDSSRPPAPWNIRPFLNEAQQRVELTFEAANIASYQEAWGRDRQFCNLMTAEADGFLEYVADNRDCLTETPRRVQLDIGEYLVYRFDSYRDASAFKDSDGDGIADSEEREDGLQCNPNSPFEGFRIEVTQETQDLASNQQILLIDDANEPVLNKGRVFWYRVASRTENGRLSLLSEPVRVNFPDRSLPNAPTVEITQPGSEICGCTVETHGDKQWSFLSELPSSNGAELSLQCTGFAPSPVYQLDDKSIAGPDSNLCASDSFTQQCNDAATRDFTYTASNGDTFGCSLPAYSGVNMCGNNSSVRIKPDYCEAQVPAPIGVVSGPLLITVTPDNPAHCVSLNQQVAGQSVNLGTSCSTESASFEYEHIAGEFCGFAVTHDANNNISATTQIGCRSIPPQSEWSLAPAQPVSLVPAGNQMSLQWRLPAQVQSMVEVELARREPGGFEPIRTRLPAVSYNGGGLQDVKLDIPSLTAESEQWCVRLRTYAPTAIIGEPRYSNWSAPLCDNRTLVTESPPQWLPWPQLATVPEGDPLVMQSSDTIQFSRTNTGSTRIPVASSLYFSLGEFKFSSMSDCQLPLYVRGQIGNYDSSVPDTGRYLTDLMCNNSGFARASQVIEENLDFMVFRQARTPSGQTSQLVQVTPLIDRANWESVIDDKGLQVLGNRLRDPFIWAVADADTSSGSKVELIFIDRVGLVNHYDYRYQVVYFDPDKRLRQWRATPWVSYEVEDGEIIVGPAQLIDGVDSAEGDQG
jgi:hypothetical protein